MTIKQIIKTMEKRPGMFMESKNLESIYYLLAGYCGAKNSYEKDSIDAKFCVLFRKWLSEWIENNVDSNYKCMSIYWYHDIRAITDNEDSAVELFFELSKMFFEDYEKSQGYFAYK